jgi:hypothetical protein
MGSPSTLDPTRSRPPDLDPALEGRAELLEHLQTPAAFGGHEFGDWPVDQIANGLPVAWTPATATITPAWPTSSPTAIPSSSATSSVRPSTPSTG